MDLDRSTGAACRQPAGSHASTQQQLHAKHRIQIFITQYHAMHSKLQISILSRCLKISHSRRIILWSKIPKWNWLILAKGLYVTWSRSQRSSPHCRIPYNLTIGARNAAAVLAAIAAADGVGLRSPHPSKTRVNHSRPSTAAAAERPNAAPRAI